MSRARVKATVTHRTPDAGRTGVAEQLPPYGIDFLDRPQRLIDAEPESEAVVRLSQRSPAMLPQRMRQSPHDLTHKEIRHLHRIIGNRAVGRMLASAARTPQTTALSANLKAGIETLSGMAMDDVTVHYNSDKPAQVYARAYTQGREIYVGPHQEQHLPHEAWHVVQQKQGRVKPTLQARQALINDDSTLENEAERMGEQALQVQPSRLQAMDPALHLTAAQRNARMKAQAIPASQGVVIQRQLQLPFMNGIIGNVGLAQIKIQTLPLGQLAELWEVVATAQKELEKKYRRTAPPKDGSGWGANDFQDWLALNKANQSCAHFAGSQVSKNIFPTVLETIGKTAAEGGVYVVEGKTYYSAKELAAELHIEEPLTQALPPGRYPRISDLLTAIDETAEKHELELITERVGFPPTLLGEKAEQFKANFEPKNDALFFATLKGFRGNRNLSPNVEFSGGEGQIYLSDLNPNMCLKRWYASRIKDKWESVHLLKTARQEVERDTEVAKYVEVVQVYLEGKDWIIRDFDPTSVKIEKAAGPQISKAIAALESNKRLNNILEKVNNESDNIHWSPTLNKILVIDLM